MMRKLALMGLGSSLAVARPNNPQWGGGYSYPTFISTATVTQTAVCSIAPSHITITLVNVSESMLTVTKYITPDVTYTLCPPCSLLVSSTTLTEPCSSTYPSSLLPTSTPSSSTPVLTVPSSCGLASTGEGCGLSTTPSSPSVFTSCGPDETQKGCDLTVPPTSAPVSNSTISTIPTSSAPATSPCVPDETGETSERGGPTVPRTTVPTSPPATQLCRPSNTVESRGSSNSSTSIPDISVPPTIPNYSSAWPVSSPSCGSGESREGCSTNSVSSAIPMSVPTPPTPVSILPTPVSTTGYSTPLATSSNVDNPGEDSTASPSSSLTLYLSCGPGDTGEGCSTVPSSTATSFTAYTPGIPPCGGKTGESCGPSSSIIPSTKSAGLVVPPSCRLGSEGCGPGIPHTTPARSVYASVTYTSPTPASSALSMSSSLMSSSGTLAIPSVPISSAIYSSVVYTPPSSSSETFSTIRTSVQSPLPIVTSYAYSVSPIGSTFTSVTTRGPGSYSDGSASTDPVSSSTAVAWPGGYTHSTPIYDRTGGYSGGDGEN